MHRTATLLVGLALLAPSACATTTQPSPPVQEPASKTSAQPVVAAQPEDAKPPAPTAIASQPEHSDQTPPVAPPVAHGSSAAPEIRSGTEQTAILGALVPRSAPVMKMTVSSAKGARSVEETTSILEMARTHLEACAKLTENSEALKLDVAYDLTFRIGRKGRTSAVSLTKAGPGVVKCIVGIVRKLQFPDSKSNSKVSATILFYEDSFGSLKGGGGLGLVGSGLGARNFGAGTGSGYGSGVGRGGSRSKSSIPRIRVGNGVAVGPLDKSIIRRLMRRKLSEMRLCYERELLVRPKLEGKVTVKFQISPDGTAGAVSASGFDPKVSGCVERVVRTMVFPKPTGGGIVNVSYPFVFKPTP